MPTSTGSTRAFEGGDGRDHRTGGEFGRLTLSPDGLCRRKAVGAGARLHRSATRYKNGSRTSAASSDWYTGDSGSRDGFRTFV